MSNQSSNQSLPDRIRRHLGLHALPHVTSPSHELLIESAEEIDRLTAELEHYGRSGWYQEVKRLRAALKLYGRHRHDKMGDQKCPRWYGEGVCNCGLDEALRGAFETTPQHNVTEKDNARS